MADPAIFVCGLGRCGSSLTMQMLEAGGVLVVGTWPAYECEQTTMLPGATATAWLRRVAPGHAIKLLDPHRWTPPRELPAIVIWLDRDLAQQAQSQIKFNEWICGLSTTRTQRRRLADQIARERRAALAAIAADERRRLVVRFEGLIDTPCEAAAAIADHLYLHGGPVLDVARAAAAVLPRASSCYPGMMEVELLERGSPFAKEVVHG